MRSRAIERALFLSGICVLVGIVCLLLSHVVADRPLMEALLKDVGILLVSLGTISAVYEYLIRQQLLDDLVLRLQDIIDPDSRRLGVRAMYQSRDEKIRRGESIDNLIASTKTELFSVGLGLLAFVPERQALIKRRIQEGCRFRFLIFDATSSAAEALDRTLGAGNGELIDLIRAQTRFISNFHGELRRIGVGEQFEVRTYDTVPTFGMVEINRGLPNHLMVIEVNGFRAEGATCPGIALQEIEGGWSRFFRERAELLWETGTPIRTAAPVLSEGAGRMN
jgi:Domain of unknown function (DUF5919)